MVCLHPYPRCTRALLLTAALWAGSVWGPSTVAAQDLVLERFERWKLHPAPGDPSPRLSAQLYLFVRNDTDRLVKRWRALLVVRDTAGGEFFRLPLERDSADLGPGEVARMELRFDDQPVGNDPFDHLMANDTANIVPSFDEVLVVESAPFGFVKAGAPVCFSTEAMRAVEALSLPPATSAWREAVTDAGCHWAQQELTVEVLEPLDRFSVRVRWQRLERVVWVRRDDLHTRDD